MNEINEDQSFQIKNLVDDSYLYVSPEVCYQNNSKIINNNNNNIKLI